jgi:hypothetical protein
MFRLDRGRVGRLVLGIQIFVIKVLVLSCIFALRLYSNMIMFLFMMFLVCSNSTFDMVMIDNEFMYKFAKRLALFAMGLSGRSHVRVVLRCYLPANVSYWPGCVVVRGSDGSIKSYIVHPPLIGQAETTLRRKSCYVLAFFSDIPYT